MSYRRTNEKELRFTFFLFACGFQYTKENQLRLKRRSFFFIPELAFLFRFGLISLPEHDWFSNTDNKRIWMKIRHTFYYRTIERNLSCSLRSVPSKISLLKDTSGIKIWHLAVLHILCLKIIATRTKMVLLYFVISSNFRFIKQIWLT